MSFLHLHLPHPSDTDLTLYLAAALLGILIIMVTYYSMPAAVPQASDPFQNWLKDYAQLMMSLELLDHRSGVFY